MLFDPCGPSGNPPEKAALLWLHIPPFFSGMRLTVNTQPPALSPHFQADYRLLIPDRPGPVIRSYSRVACGDLTFNPTIYKARLTRGTLSSSGQPCQLFFRRSVPCWCSTHAMPERRTNPPEYRGLRRPRPLGALAECGARTTHPIVGTTHTLRQFQISIGQPTTDQSGKRMAGFQLSVVGFQLARRPLAGGPEVQKYHVAPGLAHADQIGRNHQENQLPPVAAV